MMAVKKTQPQELEPELAKIDIVAEAAAIAAKAVHTIERRTFGRPQNQPMAVTSVTGVNN